VNTGGIVLAHGVGSRADLPIPFSYALIGAQVALIVSFLGLLVLWRQPRLDPTTAGHALPASLARFLDSTGFRWFLRILGLVATGYVGMAMIFGKDDALNPTAYVVYVLFWVGVPLLSVIFGPVWRMLNPIRTLHLLLSKLIGAAPEDGLSPLPAWLGYWPAAFSLLGFVWLELVPTDNTTLPVLRLFFAIYLAIHLLAATYFGSRWFDRGDGFEVFSTLMGHLSVLGRRGDGRLVLRNPLVGVAAIETAPGLFGLVGVLLGSTVFDSAASHPRWVEYTQTGPLSANIANTLGLVVVVAVVTGLFTAASALSGRGTGQQPLRLASEFGHSIVPIVAGYFLAHYWSLLIVVGQQAIFFLSDPLGTGANWFGTADGSVNYSLATPERTAVLQVCAIVTGHVLGVVLAHDRALRVLPARRTTVGQIPLLALMVAYTVGGLSLLFTT
jgi:hypothetical protein